ncbi:EAL domain-containing protein [Pseudomonas fuscovaginae UPB0736]|uniref:Diguanylate cyclase/phosphodiesterase with PAS/PAC sensor(S) n=1 Tax=Pseudomonas asplenii TaxID=53407 RepID=A0A1H6P1L8_9PSED|nr:EAL domain-containing protein [Pseudomonas fuscovaginae]UUQ64034.1 EAL domain-containing protein [Pseudomonas fuscovaginae UPB0736]SEI23374.1 diguanylate cyclase/phosphodiesterase with PAS/PAC sensor(s) [Pseudomonas fuscovaginae]
MDETYRKVVDAAAIFSETDLNGRITYVNDRFCAISGYSREELLGQNHRLLNSGFHPPEFFGEMWRTLSLGQVWRGEVCNRAKDGSRYWLDSTMVPLLDEATGQVRKYLSIRFDVSEKLRLLHTLQWRVGHDVLTGLPNRAFLSELLNQSLDFARREHIPLAVCMLDLDGFKAVNDSYGHACGDALLVEVAARLRGIMRGEDVVARLSGDEFVLILRYVRDSQELQATLQRVLWAVSAPYAIHEQDIHVCASIGVTVFPDDDEDPDTLLRHADQAMYLAKQGGRNRFHLFDVSLDREVRATYQSVASMRRALEADELRLVYQPKVNLRTGQVVGFEALVHWQSPQRGLLEPHEFLPLVAQTDVIGEIGEWVIDRVLAQIQAWRRTGYNWPVSLNIAARHFQRADFVPRLQALLARYAEVPAQMLDLEIVESVAIENIQRVSQCLQDCQALGVRFSLDDFGTGYSSLSYLKRLRTQTIKIDRSFIRDILHDQDDLALTKAVIGLARAFGREVIAEGLETAEQGRLLISLGCDVAQGSFVARPMAAQAVPAWVAAFVPSPLWQAPPDPVAGFVCE